MRILLILVFISACAPMSEVEYKRRKVEKESKIMFKKVKRARRWMSKS